MKIELEGPPMRGKCSGCGIDLEELVSFGHTGHLCSNSDRYGAFDTVVEADVYFTEPKPTITAERMPDGAVRLATETDAIRILDLDAAIVELCKLRQAQDPEGYDRFVTSLLPEIEETEPVLTYRGLVETLARSGRLVDGEVFKLPNDTLVADD